MAALKISRIFLKQCAVIVKEISCTGHPPFFHNLPRDSDRMAAGGR